MWEVGILVIIGAIIMGFFSKWWHERRGRGISLVIPFRAPADKDNQRVKNFEWVCRYWQAQLPGAEIIIGQDNDLTKPFSKSVAINQGVFHTSGDVLVLIDADAYVSPKTILACAKEIRKARKKEHKLWFVPYRQFYRLNREASARVLCSEPCKPYEFPCPPDWCDVIDCSGSDRGHWYGAMIQIMPREAFYAVGGWDPRFRGWGGEDSASMRATDTLYTPHRTFDAQVLHLWHPMLSPTGAHDHVSYTERMWPGQKGINSNGALSWRYFKANNHRVAMRALVNEWLSLR